MHSTVRASLLLAGEQELVALIDHGDRATGAGLRETAVPLLARIWPHARAAPLRVVGVVASVFTLFFLLAVVGHGMEGAAGAALLTALLLALPSFLVARSAFAAASRRAAGPVAPVVSGAERLRVVEQRATRVQELLRTAPGPVTFEQIRDRLGWTHVALASAVYALIVRGRLLEDVDLETGHLLYVLPSRASGLMQEAGHDVRHDEADPLATAIDALMASSADAGRGERSGEQASVTAPADTARHG